MSTLAELSLGIFIAGQSYASPLLYGTASQVFEDTVKQGVPNAYVDGYALGGSAAHRTHAPANSDWRWWYDADTGEYGPALLSALSEIASTGKRYQTILWLQGEADSVWNHQLASDPVELEKYYYATRQILWRLKQAANPSQPNSVRVLMIHIGRRIWVSDAPAVQLIRDQQYRVIESSPSLYNLPGIYDLPLIGEMEGSSDNHHYEADEHKYAMRAAWAVRWLYGDRTAKQAPVATSATTVSSDSVKLTFSRGKTYTKHASPEAFALIESDGTINTDLEFQWVGEDLEIKADHDLQGDVYISYPYGQGDDYDLSQIILDNDQLPITPFKRKVTFPEIHNCISSDEEAVQFIEGKYGSLQQALLYLLDIQNNTNFYCGE